MMNGNFQIPIEKNPDEELGCKFDPFSVSLSVIMALFIVALGVLIFFIVTSFEQSEEYDPRRMIPGSIFGQLNQDCSGFGA